MIIQNDSNDGKYFEEKNAEELADYIRENYDYTIESSDDNYFYVDYYTDMFKKTYSVRFSIYRKDSYFNDEEWCDDGIYVNVLMSKEERKEAIRNKIKAINRLNELNKQLDDLT